MTSRYDLLDQYIDARNAGKQPEFDPGGDPELARLIETVEQIDDGTGIEWPGNDFPIRMGRNLSARLGTVSHARNSMDAELAEDSGSAPRIVPGGRSEPHGKEQGGFPWYARQFAGMAAAALVVALLVGGLAILYGDWGDRFQQSGATVVEPGDLPGTILFVEFDSANQKQTISRIDADGTNQISLATRPAMNGAEPGIDWSPDGEWVAYVERDEYDEPLPTRIMIVSADGEQFRHVTDSEISGATASDSSPQWSPDGQSLAYVYSERETNRTRIDIVHLQTGEVQTVPTSMAERAPNDSSPSWSPDGQRLAFSRIVPLRERGIYIMRYGQPEPQQIVGGEQRLSQPSWSPDGDSIVYVGGTDVGERGNVRVVDVDTRETANITNHDRWDYLPKWSSRGQIAFMSDFGDGSTDIFIVRPDGSDLRNLTEDYDWRVFKPDWSDDGRYLTFTSANESQDRWRINVYDIETNELYSVLESENPLYHAQWRPDPDAVETGHETEIEHVDIGLTDEQIELIQRSVEGFLSEDETSAVRVNDEVISAEQIAHQLEGAQVTRAAQEGMEQEFRWPPEMRLFRASLEELNQEAGLENVVLGGLLASSAVQQWAEERSLAATQDQIDEDVERQREMYEQIRAQVPEDQPLPQDIIIDAIGEDRYWDEYLPEILRESLTEWNADQAALEEAGIGRIESSLESVERDLILAEFRADLVREAEIEVLDLDALGEADLDRAIEYITETYPAFLREQLEQLPEPDTAEDPALPGDAELTTADEAEAAAREFAEEEGRELGTLLYAHLISADDYASEYGEVPPGRRQC